MNLICSGIKRTVITLVKKRKKSKDNFLSPTTRRKESHGLSHAVVLLKVTNLLGTVKINADADVQITWISSVRGRGQLAVDLFALHDHEWVVEVEDGLAPVSRLSPRSSVQDDSVVSGEERGVKVNGDSVDGVVTSGGQDKGGGEGQFRLGHLGQVHAEERWCIRRNLVVVYAINQWLNKAQPLEVGEVETHDVVPAVESVLDVLWVVNAASVHVCMRREQLDIRGAEFVAGVEDGVEHGFVQKEVTHPLRDDDIDLVDALWHGDLLHLAVKNSNDILKVVLLDNLSGLVSDRGALDRHHALRTSTSSEHGEDTSSAAHIQNDLALEHVRVHHDGVAVGLGTVGVLEHLHMDPVVSIAIKVVVAVVAGGSLHVVVGGFSGHVFCSSVLWSERVQIQSGQGASSQ